MNWSPRVWWKKTGKGNVPLLTQVYPGTGLGAHEFYRDVRGQRPGGAGQNLEAGIKVPESSSVREMLNLNEGDPAVRICRLRYAGERPLVVEDNYYPLEYAYLLSIDLENDSTYRYLREVKGIELRSTTMRLGIIRANAKLAKLLQVSRNAPQLEMKGKVVRLSDGQTVHSSYQVGYGEDFEFVIRQ